MGDFWVESPDSYVDLDFESRKFFLHPWLRSRINDINPSDILDFGCGDGSLFAGYDVNYKRLFLYDHSDRMLSIAKNKFNNSTFVEISSDKDNIQSESFDLIVCSLVLMTIKTKEKLEEVFEIMFRGAKRGAHFLIAITHPCFRQYKFSTFSTEFTEKPFHYLSEGTPFSVYLTDSKNDKSIEFVDYHWTVSTTINLALKIGMQLNEIIELPDKAILEYLENKQFPGYIVFDFYKPHLI